MKRTHTGYLIKSYAMATIAAASISSAHAATIEYASGSSTVAAGISDLTVGSAVYDVNFIGTVSHLGWASSLDVTSETEATAVIEEIAAVFAGAGINAVEYETLGGGTYVYDTVTLWYGTSGSNLLGLSIDPDNLGGWEGFTGNSTAPLNSAYPFAVDLTVTSVPVPAAIWLFGSGLLGLAGVARKRNHA